MRFGSGGGDFADQRARMVEYQLRRHVGIETQILFPKVMDLIREQLAPDPTKGARPNEKTPPSRAIIQ